jgi:serine/threonine protein kinase
MLAIMDIETRIGPYEVRERIGEGGMATVYKAWHTGLHRFEALKVPRAGAYGADPEFIQRLLTEARLAARLHHPHIVAIHNISEADSPRHYFSMDLVEGTDLSQLLEEHIKLPYEESLTILRQTADALDHAHSQGVIHRDVKPDNILLQEKKGDWWVRVVDFGISRAAEDTSGTRLTKSGMLVGTPEYMSPEQSGSGEIVGYRTDIYSLGVVAYEMLTGEPPFTAGDGVSRMSILLSHVRDEPKPLTDFAPDVPDHASAAVLRALSKNPNDRFASCNEFMRAFSGEEGNAAGENGAVSAPTASESTLNGTAGSPVSGSTASRSTTIREKTRMAPLQQKNTPPYVILVLLAVFTFAALAPFIFRNTAPSGDVGNNVASNSVTMPAATVNTPVATVTTQPSATAAPTRTVASTRTATPAPTTQVRTVRRQETVAFRRQVRNSSSLLRGQSRVIQTGRNGLREVTLAITMRSKQEISRRRIGERIIRNSVPQIVVVGTRAPVVRRTAPTRPAPVRRRARDNDNYTPRRPLRRSRPARPNRPARRPRRSGGEAPLPP